MKVLYRIKTVDSEHRGYANYNVLATTAEEAIEKLTPKLEKDGEEWIEEIEVLGTIDIK